MARIMYYTYYIILYINTYYVLSIPALRDTGEAAESVRRRPDRRRRPGRRKVEPLQPWR